MKIPRLPAIGIAPSCARCIYFDKANNSCNKNGACVRKNMYCRDFNAKNITAADKAQMTKLRKENLCVIIRGEMIKEKAVIKINTRALLPFINLPQKRAKAMLDAYPAIIYVAATTRCLGVIDYAADYDYLMDNDMKMFIEDRIDYYCQPALKDAIYEYLYKVYK